MKRIKKFNESFDEYVSSFNADDELIAAMDAYKFENPHTRNGSLISIMDNAIKENNIDKIKYVLEEYPGIGIALYGALLQSAYNSGNTEILELFKQGITPQAIRAIRHLSPNIYRKRISEDPKTGEKIVRRRARDKGGDSLEAMGEILDLVGL